MIYDISQPVFECAIYPGDPQPEKQALCRMERGDLYNLTAFSVCAHNGTHIDAPFHFFRDGKAVDEISLEKMIGAAFVCTHSGDVTAADAEKILTRARNADPEAARRILLRGDATVTEAAAGIFADAGIDLLGNEAQSVGPMDAPMAVHQRLLAKEVVLLEGIRLKGVPDGVYFLNCAPLNLTGADGAPCRAVLTELR